MLLKYYTTTVVMNVELHMGVPGGQLPQILCPSTVPWHWKTVWGFPLRSYGIFFKKNITSEILLFCTVYSIFHIVTLSLYYYCYFIFYLYCSKYYRCKRSPLIDPLHPTSTPLPGLHPTIVCLWVTHICIEVLWLISLQPPPSCLPYEIRQSVPCLWIYFVHQFI